MGVVGEHLRLLLGMHLSNLPGRPVGRFWRDAAICAGALVSFVVWCSETKENLLFHLNEITWQHKKIHCIYAKVFGKINTRPLTTAALLFIIKTLKLTTRWRWSHTKTKRLFLCYLLLIYDANTCEKAYIGLNKSPYLICIKNMKIFEGFIVNFGKVLTRANEVFLPVVYIYGRVS